MALLDLLLGKENPVAQWSNRNSNLLTGLGTSLLSNGMDFTPAQQGSVLDRQAAAQKDADAKLAASTNATKQWLSQNYPDLAQAVDAGLPVSEAWQEAFNRKNQKGAQPQNPYMSAGDGQFFNWQTGDFVANPNAAPKPPNLPTSYQEFQLALSDPAYAATLSSSTSKPPTDSQRRASQLTKAITPDAELLLGDGTKPGAFDALANGWDQMGGANIPFVGGAPLKAATSADYQRANNAIVNIAQSYLYAVSGAAAPAEEVDKIVKSVTPQFGENPQSVADKKVRLKQYIDAIALGQQNGGANPTADPLGIR